MEKIQIKCAVVTGAAGFVGYHLIKNLQEKGIFVVAMCRPNSAHNRRLKEFSNLKIIECDSSDFLERKEELAQYQPDVFFHLAWEGTTGEKRGAYDVQLKNIRNTCDAYTCAAQIGCQKFVATGTVYEELTQQILGMEKFSALSYYVMAKHFAYESIFQLSKKVELDWTWCLFCQPIGRFIKLNQLMAYMIGELKEKRRPQFGTAENPFDIVVVEDLAEGLYLAGENRLKENKYFIGSGEPRVLKKYLQEAGEIIAPEIELIFGERPDDGLQFYLEWLDPSAFQIETGYRSTRSFAEGILSVERWIEEYKEQSEE